ncbi:hypothetical protein COOONC_12349 [Cooperia oncophora]
MTEPIYFNLLKASKIVKASAAAYITFLQNWLAKAKKKLATTTMTNDEDDYDYSDYDNNNGNNQGQVQPPAPTPAPVVVTTTVNPRSRLAQGLVTNKKGKNLPRARNMLKLEYDCALEASAKKAVDRCSTNPSGLSSGVQEKHLQSSTSQRFFSC